MNPFIITSKLDPIPDWARAPDDVVAKARELCTADDLEPDMMTEGGYGPGYSEDGNHTAAYANAEPMWSIYIDDAIEALKRSL